MTRSATALARAVVQALLEAGVREVVLSPGSRNAPLSFAVFDAAATGRLRLHTRLDERSAGFVAVGLTKVGARAAVLCTSGTAVANLHPAVLEAAHSGLPLVVLTADRPARLRGTDANQTTDQVGIFGPLVATTDLDAEVLADGSPGLPPLAEHAPTHWNVQLDEPLVPEDRWVPVPPAVRRGPEAHGWAEPGGAVTLGTDDLRTVVVAGDGAGPAARVLAERAGWPLLAEPTSGARTGSHAIRSYRLLLGTGLGEQVQRVVVVGRPTLSRPVTRLLSRPDVEVLAVRHPGVWARPPWPATLLDAVPGVTGSAAEVSGSEGAVDGGWLAAWREADRAVSARVDALVHAGPDLTPYAVAGAVSRALPAGGLLWVGASNPIRDLDLMAARYPVGQRRKVVANRGLAGIDGVLSSAIGAALGRPRGTRNLALVGDVTFLHDSNGLVLGPAEARPDLTIVVVNDDGGSIFATLEQGAPAHADPFEKIFATPHGVDLASLCAATRTPHWRVDSLPELEHALASPNGGIEVVEAVVRRDTRRDLDLALRALRP
ncbi:2-succinyl-5-enolpyruvyl-6-hydroxy-3-cyclohexene-1-carboxylic-acid synthase [Nocardioides sp. zg-DK7169]|uniref:2-succinyl-5-enolpyruvyl-6-hydroxy-3- cyclohexene-1-carboxylic-acid synthase n=1 Tax=Nocardioides sp. zg-DK7169 TaxID=2736600 RepID=UPI0015522B85|nr:2-succinyl-5-enolpyruvyl-6-hydroxy-3-cyclohexene-1-carboxylic-acid synthase [Nocardioides sp. zg-DK7169]